MVVSGLKMGASHWRNTGGTPEPAHVLMDLHLFLCCILDATDGIAIGNVNIQIDFDTANKY